MESITTITVDELKQMRDKEGLILQGCGGEAKEWLDGINDLLTKAGVLLEGSRFEQCMVFDHEGLTNILFPFGEEKIAIGKLALWRIATHSTFGGTWLSDYLDIQFENHEVNTEAVDAGVDNCMEV